MLPHKTHEMESFDEPEDIAQKMVNAIADIEINAHSLVVHDEESFKKLGGFYALARKWKNAVEDKRKELTKDMRDQISAINKKAKEFTVVLDDVIDLINQKGEKYTLIHDQKKNEAYEEYVSNARVYGAEECIVPMKRDNVIYGLDADLIVKYEIDFDIVDIEMIPSQLLKVDESKVQALIDSGIIDIPGIKIKQKKTTHFRIKG